MHKSNLTIEVMYLGLHTILGMLHFSSFFVTLMGVCTFPKSICVKEKKRNLTKEVAILFCVLVNITVSLSISIKWSWNFIVWQVKFNRCLDPNEPFQKMPCKTVGVRVVKNLSF